MRNARLVLTEGNSNPSFINKGSILQKHKGTQWMLNRITTSKSSSLARTRRLRSSFSSIIIGCLLNSQRNTNKFYIILRGDNTAFNKAWWFSPHTSKIKLSANNGSENRFTAASLPQKWETEIHIICVWRTDSVQEEIKIKF